MPCGWEGNRRSGVALAMRHELQSLIHLQAHDLRKGDEHPACTLTGYGAPFTTDDVAPTGLLGNESSSVRIKG